MNNLVAFEKENFGKENNQWNWGQGEIWFREPLKLGNEVKVTRRWYVENE